MSHVILFVLFDVLVVGGLCCVVIFAFVSVFDCIGFIIVHIRLGFSWSSWPPLVCDFLIGAVICVWYAMVGTSYSHLAIMAPKRRQARKAAKKVGKARKANKKKKAGAKKAGGKKRASKKKSGKKKK
tara:strand:+ start:44 stop:424 length:381 start_codon:yes stop_codon:yes gene_type:complete